MVLLIIASSGVMFMKVPWNLVKQLVKKKHILLSVHRFYIKKIELRVNVREVVWFIVL
jgi:hypothetical protein